MHFTLLTLFPEMFPGSLGCSLAGKALEKGLWSLDTLQIRDFATDKHQTVDDTPYGGGAGMVMRPDVIDAGIRQAKGRRQEARVIYFTPRGVPLTQALAKELTTPASDLLPPALILLCGRYEGVDERVLQAHQPLEISIGDYILSGGEMAAMVLMDACIRLIPGVIGAEESLAQESFSPTSNFAGLLEYPHYTKPPLWNGQSVPDVLISGNHAKIAHWRREEAQKITQIRRPDLLKEKKD